MIEARNLQKSFGRVRALEDLSFTAADGSITGLLGVNGAGKSTALRILCGVLQLNSGSVYVDGRLAGNGVPSLRKSTGGLLDHTGVYARLSVRENLTYFGKLHGLSHERVRERLYYLLEVLEMTGLAERRAADLSHGQRVRVALGRALMHSPRNLVLDEPTNGLDVPSIRSLRLLLRQMRESGLCIVFSSHVLEEVQALCDHVVVLADGISVASGSPEQVCEQTGTDTFEDGFMSLVQGKGQSRCFG